MRHVLLGLILSSQTLCAGLDKYSQFIVADSQSPHAAGISVMYLGTNGFQFRTGKHALLVDPYFSRVGLTQVAFGGKIRSDPSRVEQGMKHLMLRPDAILVTHAHFDHLLDVPAIMQKTGARLLGSSVAVDLARRSGASNTDAVRPGDVRRVGPWKIRVLAATH